MEDLVSIANKVIATESKYDDTIIGKSDTDDFKIDDEYIGGNMLTKMDV